MAWTTPGTATAGEVLTAAFWNEQVRDNSNNLRALANVQSTSLLATSSFSLATATTSSDISGLTVTITPTATDSKILVTCTIVVDVDTANPIYALLFRAGSVTTGIGNASGNRSRVTSIVNCGANAGESLSFEFLDSPATTSATTYSIRLRTGSGGTRTLYINTGPSSGDAATTGVSISTITAREIPA
jgi:hypothetical protein